MGKRGGEVGQVVKVGGKRGFRETEVSQRHFLLVVEAVEVDLYLLAISAS